MIQDQRKIEEYRKEAFHYFEKGYKEKNQIIGKKWFIKSENFLKKIICYNPSDLMALANIGTVLINIGRNKEALIYVNRVLDLYSKKFIIPEKKELRLIALENKGIILGKCADKIKDKKRKDILFKKALIIFNKVLRFDFHREEALINKWVTLKNLERYDAKFVDKLLLYLEKKRNKEYRFWIFDLLYSKGFHLSYKKRYNKAIKFYKRALKRYNSIKKEVESPKNYEITHEIGLCFGFLHKTKDALHYFNQTLKLNSHFNIALFNRGISLFNLKKYHQSLQAFNRFLKIYPKDIDALIWKTQALLEIEKYAMVLETLNKLIKLDKKKGKVHKKFRDKIIEELNYND
jgi:tetratricopeptide (TPR) repeat protein